jgi:uncharacterized protein involved in exopolysaccharide biosynthesis
MNQPGSPFVYSAPPPPAPGVPAAPAPQQDHRTPRDHLDRLLSLALRTWRFRWYSALVLLLGATISLAVALLLPRAYTSETLIVYREGIGTRTVTGSEAGGDAQQKLALKLKEMVLSRTSLQKLIDEFHLYPAIVDRSGYVDAVNLMRKNIAFSAKDGETFGLSFTGPEPVLVQKLTARLAQELLAEHSKSRLEQAGETREFIDAEKKRSDDDLKDKEQQLATFIAKHPEFAKESNGINAGTQAGIAVRALSGKDRERGPVDPQLAALQREAARLQERLGMPGAKRKPDKELDPKLAAARSEAESDVRNATRDLAEKANQFTEEHPDVRAAKVRLKAAEAKLRRANDAIAQVEGEQKAKPEVDEGAIDRASLEAGLRRVQEEIANYKRRHGNEGAPAAATSAAAANAVVALETEWTRLNREVADSRDRNQQLEARQFKAAIMENAVTSGRNAQMIIVDPAYKPTHPNKGRTQVVIAGVAAAVVLALMVAFLLTFLDDRIYDRIDVESLRIAPLLGVVPRADGEKDNRG